MAKKEELTVDIELTVSDEMAAACIAILNVYLKNSAMEALVEREENGDTQIHLEEKKL